MAALVRSVCSSPTATIISSSRVNHFVVAGNWMRALCGLPYRRSSGVVLPLHAEGFLIRNDLKTLHSPFSPDVLSWDAAASRRPLIVHG
jgi:hypothetical protein